MKRVIIALLLAVTLSGCGKAAQGEARSTNRAVSVEVLTSFDGVVVYRFRDAGEYVYVAVRGREISTNWSDNCGKNCRESHTVQTVD